MAVSRFRTQTAVSRAPPSIRIRSLQMAFHVHAFMQDAYDLDAAGVKQAVEDDVAASRAP